jgi:hypothetical protein
VQQEQRFAGTALGDMKVDAVDGDAARGESERRPTTLALTAQCRGWTGIAHADHLLSRACYTLT